MKCAAEWTLVRNTFRKIKKGARRNKKESITPLPLEITRNDNTFARCETEVGAPGSEPPNKTAHWCQIYALKKQCKIAKRAVHPIDRPDKQTLPAATPDNRKEGTLNGPKVSFSIEDRDEDATKNHMNEPQQDKLVKTDQQTQFWQKRPGYMTHQITTNVIKESVKQPSLRRT